MYSMYVGDNVITYLMKGRRRGRPKVAVGPININPSLSLNQLVTSTMLARRLVSFGAKANVGRVLCSRMSTDASVRSFVV